MVSIISIFGKLTDAIETACKRIAIDMEGYNPGMYYFRVENKMSTELFKIIR